MKKLFYGLGAVAAVVTPVVAVVSCGKAEPKKAANVGVVTDATTKSDANGGQTVVAQTPAQKFEIALNNTIAFVKKSWESSDESQKVKSIFIDLGVMSGIQEEWVLLLSGDETTGKTWNNSFRDGAIQIFERSGGMNDSATAVNLTSLTNAEFKKFIEHYRSAKTGDKDTAWDDLSYIGGFDSIEDITNKNEDFLKTLNDDKITQILNLSGTALDSQLKIVKDDISIILTGSASASIKDIDPATNEPYSSFVWKNSNLSIDEISAKFTSLFKWATESAIGNVDVFKTTDTITLSNSITFDHGAPTASLAAGPRIAKAGTIIKTFKFDGVEEK